MPWSGRSSDGTRQKGARETVVILFTERARPLTSFGGVRKVHAKSQIKIF